MGWGGWKTYAAVALLAIALLCEPSIAQVAGAVQPATTPQGQMNLPAGQQIGVTTLPAPVVIQSAPTAKLPLGDYIGEILMWIAGVFGTTIGTVLTALFVKMLRKAGVEASQQMSDKLDDIIVRGLNLAATEGAAALKGKGEVEIKNVIAARAVQYAQEHGAETLKALGAGDPASSKAVEAIKARIATVIADPTQPTPPIIDGKNPEVIPAPAA